MISPEATFDQPLTPSLGVRALALVRKWGLFVVAVLLPGGSLIALGVWLYSRHKSGKPLLPPALRMLAAPKFSVANRALPCPSARP
jgi:hypothetical protein